MDIRWALLLVFGVCASSAYVWAEGESSAHSAVVGKVVVQEGQLIVRRGSSGLIKSEMKARVGFSIERGDELEARSGRALVKLDDGTTMALPPSSQIEIQQMASAKPMSLPTRLWLKTGSIRCKSDSTVEVSTSVGRVRSAGADFVVSLEESGDTVMRLQVLAGDSQFFADTIEKSVKVAANHQAFFTVQAHNRNSGRGVAELDRGFFSTVHPVAVEARERLVVATAIAEPEEATPVVRNERAPATSQEEPTICSLPAGRYNQCAWSCEGNPRGAKRCLLERSQVQCVRRRCNANGQWAEESRLSRPESQGHCVSPTAQVADCS